MGHRQYDFLQRFDRCNSEETEQKKDWQSGNVNKEKVFW